MPFPVDPSRYFAFAGVMVVFACTPGPANLFQIALGAQRGARAAILSMLGMNTATLVWFGAAALGLDLVAKALPGLFQLLTFVGVAYLVALAAQALAKAFRAEDPVASAKPVARPGAHPFVQGFLVQIANPKVMLFFGAIIPPFVDLHRALPPQMAAFAATNVFFDVITMTGYGLGGAALAERMNEPRFARGFAAFTGTLLLIAAALALLRR